MTTQASTALDVAGMAARISLTFVPVLLLKNFKSKKEMKWAEKLGHPDLEQKRIVNAQRIRYRNIVFHILLIFPILLFWLTIVASAERTPLTGR